MGVKEGLGGARRGKGKKEDARWELKREVVGGGRGDIPPVHIISFLILHWNPIFFIIFIIIIVCVACFMGSPCLISAFAVWTSFFFRRKAYF